jgi:protein-tyrosine phosphatase
MPAHAPPTAPIQVDYLPPTDLTLPGRLGLTVAPGTWQAFRTLDFRSTQELIARDISTLATVHRAHAVVTLQELAEMNRLGLAGLRDAVKAAGMTSLWLPIPDCDVPERPKHAVPLVGEIVSLLRDGKTVIVHCLGGLGRSGTIAACVLVQLGAAPDEAIAKVRAARKGAIQTEVQELFVGWFEKVKRPESGPGLA